MEEEARRILMRYLLRKKAPTVSAPSYHAVLPASERWNSRKPHAPLHAVLSSTV